MAISPVPVSSPLTLETLKSAKNSVIGNPTAKVALAREPAFVAGYVLAVVIGRVRAVLTGSGQAGGGAECGRAGPGEGRGGSGSVLVGFWCVRLRPVTQSGTLTLVFRT